MKRNFYALTLIALPSLFSCEKKQKVSHLNTELFINNNLNVSKNEIYPISLIYPLYFRRINNQKLVFKLQSKIITTNANNNIYFLGHYTDIHNGLYLNDRIIYFTYASISLKQNEKNEKLHEKKLHENF